MQMAPKMKEAIGTKPEWEGTAGWDSGMRGLFWLLVPYPECEQ